MRSANDVPDLDSGTPGMLAHPDELHAALSQGLDLPLSALRASMEALTRSLPSGGESQSMLDGALEEVNRIGRNVRELIEYAQRPVPMPLRCTPTEIVESARATLERERDRIVAAHVTACSMIETDAPLLGRCLHRVVENALESGTEEILIAVRQDEECTSFAVVDSSPESFDSDWATCAFRSTKRNRLGLGLAITERDVELLGGTLRFERTQLGETCVTISIPNRIPQKATTR